MNTRRLDEALIAACLLNMRARSLVSSMRTVRSDAEFHEEDHPRASDGRFGEKAGSNGSSSRSVYKTDSLVFPKGAPKDPVKYFKGMLSFGGHTDEEILQAGRNHYGDNSNKLSLIKAKRQLGGASEKPPAEKPPAEKPPAEKPPAEKPPAEKPAAETPVAEKPPAEKPPAEKPPAVVERDEHVQFKAASGKIDHSRIRSLLNYVPSDQRQRISAVSGSSDPYAVAKAYEIVAKQQASRLSANAKESMIFYKGSAYSKINACLTQDTLSSESDMIKELVSGVDEACASGVVPKRVTVFRGIGASLQEVTGFSNSSDAVGSCFVHKNFVSTSRSREVAQSFMKTQKPDRVLMKMSLKAGTPAHLMTSQNEEEILLPRNAVMRVTKVDSVMVEGKRHTLLHVDYEGTLENSSDETVRSDADWDEFKHPRAADGKFGHGGGAAKVSKASSAYQKIYANKSPPKTIEAFNTAMIMWGGLRPDEIVEEGKKLYGSKSSKKNLDKMKQWLIDHGKKVPEFGEKSEEPSKEKAWDPNGPTPEQKKAYVSKQLGELLKKSLDDPDTDHEVLDKLMDKIQFAEKSGDLSTMEKTLTELSKPGAVAALAFSEKKEPLPKTVHNRIAQLAKYQPSFENKSVFDAKIKEIQEAAAKNDLDSVKPIQNPTGLAQKELNKFLQEYQEKSPALFPKNQGELETGAKLIEPASTVASATTAPSSSVKKKSRPHSLSDTTTCLESADGTEIAARLKINTRDVPTETRDEIESLIAKHGVTSTIVSNALDDWAHDQVKTWSEPEKKALFDYKASLIPGGYKDMNYWLNTGKPRHDNLENLAIAKKNIAHLDEVMKRSRISADVDVWRGLSCSFKDLSGFDDPDEAVGRCFEHKNYASVSRDRDVSKFFGDRVLLKMSLKAGTPGVVMVGQGEQEIVLPRAGVFRVDKVEKNGDKHVVHVTYVGTREGGPETTNAAMGASEGGEH